MTVATSINDGFIQMPPYVKRTNVPLLNCSYYILLLALTFETLMSLSSTCKNSYAHCVTKLKKGQVIDAFIKNHWNTTTLRWKICQSTSSIVLLIGLAAIKIVTFLALVHRVVSMMKLNGIIHFAKKKLYCVHITSYCQKSASITQTKHCSPTMMESCQKKWPSNIKRFSMTLLRRNDYSLWHYTTQCYKV